MNEQQFEGQSVVPYSIESEQAVLGGLLIDGLRLSEVAELLKDNDFYLLEHRLIYQNMQSLNQADKPIDIITLAEELDRRDLLQQIGGIAQLGQLKDNTPSSANIITYAGIVHDHAIRRQLIGTSGEIERSAQGPEGLDSRDLVQLAENKIAAIAALQNSGRNALAAKDLIEETLAEIERLFEAGNDLTGLASGINELDQKTAGWQAGQLIILAARPAMGKTALAMNFVESALLKQPDNPVLVFSLEMPASALMMRMLCSQGKIDHHRMRSGKLTPEDWAKLSAATSKIQNTGLYIDDSASLSPQDIRARIGRIVSAHKVKLCETMDLDVAEQKSKPALIVVDYLQLMEVTGSKEGRTQEVSQISRAMKAIARDFECPVIALSQLSRNVESRPNRRPVNADLRDSGAIEQDADIILFIYRDEYYNENTEQKGIAELIIGKQRNGETGTIKTAFLGQFSRFENLAIEQEQVPPHTPSNAPF